VVIEQKFMPGDTDFSHELEIIRDSRVDGIVIWADEGETAGILKQMRAMGMKQRVFGSYRTLGPDLLAQAGATLRASKRFFLTTRLATTGAGSTSIADSRLDTMSSRSSLHRWPMTP
jgi:ABC-type branched-subunit amino acid transport system substrate-binding protein